MNKKNLFIILATLSVLTACSDKTEENNSAVTAAQVNNYTAQATDRSVTGEVVSVTENEVTLAVGTLKEDKGEKSSFKDGKPDFNVERPAMPEGKMPSFKDGKPDFDGELPEMNGRERHDFGSEMSQSPSGGGFPKDGDFPSGEDRPEGGRRRSSRTVEKTGSEESYIIPVGMNISGLSGRNTDYKGITAGMVLTLTVNSDGVVCAASVE